MAKETIRDCIVKVLKENGKPMSSADIYDTIVKKGLYQFNTANASNVVRSQLRRHCKNVERKDSASSTFEMTSNGLFTLLD